MGVIKFIRQYPNDCTKILRVLDSCKTLPHLEVASKMIDALWTKWDITATQNETIVHLIIEDRQRFKQLVYSKGLMISAN
jgi:hypothetical protein